MKKTLTAIFIVAAMASCAPLIQFVRAQTVDLGVENVGLLPSNPFYFLKEWGRGFRKLFTGNPISKAKIELDIVNEKAAELEKFVEIAPYNKAGLAEAFASFESAVANLAVRLNSFTDTTANPDVDKLVNDITGRTLLYQTMLDQLWTKFSKDQSALDQIAAAHDGMTVMLNGIVSKLDTGNMFRVRLAALARAGSGSFRDIPAIEFARDLGLREAEGDLAADLDGHLQGLQSAASTTLADSIGGIPGNQLLTIQIIDLVREMTDSNTLHNALNFIRQDMLDQADARELLNEDAVSSAIARAQNLIDEDSAMPGSGRAAAKEGLSRAKFNLDQAEKLSQENNLEGAFGQASAASAAAENVWYLLMPEAMGDRQILDSLKQYYDQLVEIMKSNQPLSDDHPEIISLLNGAEKQMLGIEKLDEGHAKPEVIAQAAKNVRVMLSLIDEVIYQAMHPQESKPAMEHASMNGVIPDSATIVISDKGFTPPVITVKVGTKVTWFNKDVQPHWPASDPYPENSDLPNLNAKNGLKQGETYSYVFDQVGHWGYHDDLNPELTGTVIVAE